MSAGLAEATMAERKTIMTRIEESAIEEARLASSFVGMTLVDYLSDRIRRAAKIDIDEGIARRQAAEKPPKRSK